MVAKKNLCVLILAAGKGTRMKSALPKPLHPVCGRPIISHILQAAQTLQPAAIGVVVGHEGQQLMDAISQNLTAWGITAPIVFIPQMELNGSASAVQVALPLLKKYETVMVLCGDTPMIRPETLQQMESVFEGEKPGTLVLGVTVPNPTGYGRILRKKDGSFERIIEETEADETIKKISEVNSGMYLFDVNALVCALGKLTPQGPKKEFYLPDTLAFIKDESHKVLVFNSADYEQALGINSRVQLALVEDIMRSHIAARLMEEGVRLVRPKEVYIDDTVKIGEDTTVCPGCYISGNTVIGKNCRLDGSVFLNDCIIGDNVHIKMSSYIEAGSVVEDGCEIGPFAHLRAKSILKKKAKVGNFCEIKNSTIGEGSKVSHLSYIGDTQMGAGVNVGAGTITCNYDGVNKHQTVIGDHVFVGSNVNFVAPVTVAAFAKIGAGSTITKEVPEGSLAIARARQVVLEKKGIKHD